MSMAGSRGRTTEGSWGNELHKPAKALPSGEGGWRWKGWMGGWIGGGVTQRKLYRSFTEGGGKEREGEGRDGEWLSSRAQTLLMHC